MVHPALKDIYNLPANSITFNKSGWGNFTSLYKIEMFREEYIPGLIKVEASDLCSGLIDLFPVLNDYFQMNISMVIGNHIYTRKNGELQSNELWVKMYRTWYHHDNWGKNSTTLDFLTIKDFVNSLKTHIDAGIKLWKEEKIEEDIDPSFMGPYELDLMYNYRFQKEELKDSWEKFLKEYPEKHKDDPEFKNFNRTKLIDKMLNGKQI